MPLLFFDISGGELLVILLAVFLIFGPKRVPEIARQVGRGMNELKKATSDLTREFQEGANEIRREVQKVSSDVKEEAGKLSQELLAGPSDVARELENTTEESLPEAYRNAGTSPGPSGTMSRNGPAEPQSGESGTGPAGPQAT